MIIYIIQVLAMFGVPLLILNLRNTKIVKAFGMIGIAYGLGILVSLLVFGLSKISIDVNLNIDIFQIGSYVAIGVAIPLLLFSSNLKEAKKLSTIVLKSFASLIVCLLIVTTICVLCFKNLDNRGPLGAMALGLYTGGTPNLDAIGNILKVDNNTIALANLSDMLIGGVFYVFLLLFAKPLLKKFLPTKNGTTYHKEESGMTNYESLEKKPLKSVKHVFFCILLALLMAIASAAIGVIIWLINGSVEGTMLDSVVPCLLIGVTILGIIGSFNTHIREVEGNNLIGQYLILVFSFALASGIDFNTIGNNFLQIFLFFTTITIGSFILHIFAAKLLHIDIDCTLITLTAGLYGPAFVPAIAKQVNNDDIVAPGLIIGSLGYALGTFLGLLISLLYNLI